ncbi:MAG: transcriptional regulator [Myxococcaceae bacterium]
MPESQWDEQLKRFLKKTGEDLKRAGADIKVEAQRLMKEVQDPARQKKVKEGLKDLGNMAKKAAEEVATVVEAGVKKAEEAFKPKASAAPSEGAAATPPSPPPEGMPAAKKSIGGKRPRAAKPKAPKGGKTIGRKRS